MKPQYTISLFFIFFYLQTSAQSPSPLYLSMGAGLGGTYTQVLEDIENVQQVGLAIPIQMALGFRFSDRIGIELSFAHHLKQYQVNLDRFSRVGNPIRVTRGLTTMSGNFTVGLNAYLKLPIQQGRRSIGALVGYNQAFYPATGVGTATCGGERNFDCDLGMLYAGYDISGISYRFLNFGLFSEQKIGLKNHIRYGIHYRTGGGEPRPMTGEMIVYLGEDEVENIPFYNNGSFWSLDFAYIINL
ncbi:MAG: hypothetical protein R3E32_11075 [Chitinophagales bacterium]